MRQRWARSNITRGGTLHGQARARHLSVLDLLKDLREWRKTVADTLSRLGQFAVRMEMFPAKPPTSRWTPVAPKWLI